MHQEQYHTQQRKCVKRFLKRRIALSFVPTDHATTESKIGRLQSDILSYQQTVRLWQRRKISQVHHHPHQPRTHFTHGHINYVIHQTLFQQHNFSPRCGHTKTARRGKANLLVRTGIKSEILPRSMVVKFQAKKTLKHTCSYVI